MLGIHLRVRDSTQLATLRVSACDLTPGSDPPILNWSPVIWSPSLRSARPGFPAPLSPLLDSYGHPVTARPYWPMPRFHKLFFLVENWQECMIWKGESWKWFPNFLGIQGDAFSLAAILCVKGSIWTKGWQFGKINPSTTHDSHSNHRVLTINLDS